MTNWTVGAAGDYATFDAAFAALPNPSGDYAIGCHESVVG